MKICERCGAEPEGQFDLLDYCGFCSRDLCSKCMAAGCCGHTPAVSGEQEDEVELTDEEAAAWQDTREGMHKQP